MHNWFYSSFQLFASFIVVSVVKLWQ